MKTENRAVAELLTITLLLAAPAAADADVKKTTPAEVEEAALTLLEMRPDANWTLAYNALVNAGPRSIEYVVNRPAMQRRAAPDDLSVILHTSLVRLLARPGDRPDLSINCFETSLGLLHFDPKVAGARLGTVAVNNTRAPTSWLDLYPADFDQSLAARVNVEADRLAVLRWWRARRDAGESVTCAQPLRPVASWLWPVLARRYADLWTYEPDRETVQLCTAPPADAALLQEATRDYNLVRAACIWLAGSDAAGVQRDLIERVADRSPIVSHNARFALERSPDERIREVIERYKQPVEPPEQPLDHRSVNAAETESNRGQRRASPEITVSCGRQGGDTHEVVQVGYWIRGCDRLGDFHSRSIWGRRNQAAARRG